MTQFKADRTGPGNRDCVYLETQLSSHQGYPSVHDFEVHQTNDGRGNGIVARKQFASMTRMCRVSGLLVSRRRLHTLQILPNVHMYDPHFAGLLLHSCNPNVFLDMSELWLWSLTDIREGDCLTMDYASTEQKLYRQFACRCGSSNCHGWITGYDESPNEQGMEFLRHWRRRCHRN
jgi:hypothetical protein